MISPAYRTPAQALLPAAAGLSYVALAVQLLGRHPALIEPLSWAVGVLLAVVCVVLVIRAVTDHLSTTPKERRRSAAAQRLIDERRQQPPAHGLTDWLRDLTRVAPGELPDETTEERPRLSTRVTVELAEAHTYDEITAEICPPTLHPTDPGRH